MSINIAIGHRDAYALPPDEGLDTAFEATGDIGVEFGPLRLAVAEHFGKNPEDVTGQDVAQYEMDQEAQA